MRCPAFLVCQCAADDLVSIQVGAEGARFGERLTQTT